MRITIHHLNAIAQGWAFREFDGRCRGFEPAAYSSKLAGDAPFALDDQAEAHAVFERALALWLADLPSEPRGYRWAMVQGLRAYHKELFLMGGTDWDGVGYWRRRLVDSGYIGCRVRPELRRFLRVLRHVVARHVEFRASA